MIARAPQRQLKTAFEPGKPAAGAGPAPVAANIVALKESTCQRNSVVVAEHRPPTDNLWVRNQSFFGQRFATAWANNGDFVASTRSTISLAMQT